jgi:hypothetical protein
MNIFDFQVLSLLVSSDSVIKLGTGKYFRNGDSFLPPVFMSALVSSHSAIADAECMNVTAELLLHNV